MAPSSCASRTFCCSTGFLRLRWPRPKLGRAMPTAPSRSSTKRWRLPNGLAHRAFEAELHRARGEILLKRDPANSAPAEEAFLTAIAVAKQQGARSFELRAALALAKLYQSTGRPAEAHAVLAPALEGFAPTPEMPEIAEAQALLAALAETDEVKAAIAQRQRRLKLQTSYGQAMMLSRGFASEESIGAFTRARELFEQLGNTEQQFDTYYGLFISQLLRGEIGTRARDRGSVSARSRKRGSFDGSGGRESQSGHGLPL